MPLFLNCNKQFQTLAYFYYTVTEDKKSSMNCPPSLPYSGIFGVLAYQS